MAAKSSSKTPDARGTAPNTTATGSRAAAIALTGLGVLVIAACAVLLSYNGIYQIARQGNVDARPAHLYPAGFTLLLLMAFWTSYLLRAARRARRLWVDALILALILASAGASVLNAMGDRLIPQVAVVLVAVAPWVALLLAFRIFLWVVMHLRGEDDAPPRARRRRRGPSGGEADGGGADTAPTAPIRFDDTETPVLASDDTAPAATPAAEPPATGEDTRPTAPTRPALLWPRTDRNPSRTPARNRADSGDDPTVRVLDAAEEGAAQPVPPARTEDRTIGDADADTAPSETTSVAEEPDRERTSEEPDRSSGEGEQADLAEPASEARSETAEEAEGAAGDSTAASTARAPLAPEDTGELPKRTPGAGENPIKRAAEVPTMPASVTSDAGANSDAAEGDAGAPEAAAAVDAGEAAPLDDGFVHEPLPADPSSDEADIGVEDTPAHDPGTDETADAPPSTDRIGKRPMVRRPRHPHASNLPKDPPSLRVRSEPTPPQDT